VQDRDDLVQVGQGLDRTGMSKHEKVMSLSGI
jgi:hypothetical protein